MRAREIAPNIYWVGVVDWDIRYFHGPAYSTHRGTTYNAYLIVDEKVALVDTVMKGFEEELLEAIREVIDPARIDVIISNHSEIDHSGALPQVIAAAPNAKLYCTAKGAEFLEQQFHGGWDYNVVQNGDEIKLGQRTLTFLEAPMLHWPDSMFTYIKEDAILMPNDAFGQHYASSERFDDEVDIAEVMQEARKYYANILTPFSRQVAKKLQEVQELGIPIRMICPSHGIIWRQDPGRIVQAYAEWSTNPGAEKVVIAYDTMWESTRVMAEALARGIAREGVAYQLFRISSSDRNDIITQIKEAKAVAIGSPTYNRGMLPTVAPLVDDLVALRPFGKLALAFGSDGWGGGAIGAINEYLRKARFELFSDGVAVKWRPDKAKQEEIEEIGASLARAVKEGTANGTDA
ncbi:MAG: FprA family A-type flavoprotein [Bacillota bacterium]|jgi:anaerobic nitric oxide reductase flavorubredoxin